MPINNDLAKVDTVVIKVSAQKATDIPKNQGMVNGNNLISDDADDWSEALKLLFGEEESDDDEEVFLANKDMSSITTNKNVIQNDLNGETSNENLSGLPSVLVGNTLLTVDVG